MFIIEYISKLPDILHAITMIISGASIIASLTPSQVDNNFLNLVSKIINTLSFNIGKAKNADDV
jgi:hypothetical protein|tara:strand:- start:419 stop:610 length:192 start_codon:yes stop_codon:yes gene_type:complete